ncbi:hypothetical protein RFI_33039 [Reticulomyxa filosa]|uniref:Uncharacterized protein n=1 Tax=Reticulomyxa filosa TaxID=46433 RepID=X6LRX8_RETFI|nr:hypothetical protein RFI_33039 [Reticulomyxa filosa]|eukprot:ETO04359.1 hypothetical protein RFI_33039 [Reticulomyxa filosa]
MNVVKDAERILYQEPNLIHSFDYWTTDIFNKTTNIIGLQFNVNNYNKFFFLRYLMTFKRDELKCKFKNGLIKIFCGNARYSKIMKKGDVNESPKKKSIENEFKKWKIAIRLEQDKYNPVVWCLNQEDLLLFFQSVPPGEDCLK